MLTDAFDQQSINHWRQMQSMFLLVDAFQQDEDIPQVHNVEQWPSNGIKIKGKDADWQLQSLVKMESFVMHVLLHLYNAETHARRGNQLQGLHRPPSPRGSSESLLHSLD